MYNRSLSNSEVLQLYQMQVTDTSYPIFSNNLTSIANGSQYNSANNYQFNITILNSNGTAGIEFNNVNYTLSNVSNSFYWNVGSLGVGTYSYYYWSYGDGTSHLFNNSQTYSYTVTKNSSYVLGLAPTTPITYGATTDFVTHESGCPSSLSCSLNISDAIYSAGTISANYSTSGNANYSAGSVTATITISQANSQTSLTFDKTSPQSYTNSITPTCSVITGQGTPVLSLNGTIITSGSSITLGVGTWSFNCSLADNGNYSYAENLTNFQITQNDSYVLSLSVNPSWNVNYGTQTNVSGSGCPSQLTCNLYNNVSGAVSNGVNLTLGAGNYNFTYNTTGNENYSSISVSNILTVSKANGYANLSLNGAENNLTLTYPQQTNITASTLYGTLIIYKDGADITSSNGLNQTYGSGYYNITAYSSENENYTSSYKTFWLNITKAIPTITTLLNGVNNNLTIVYPEQVNASGLTTGGTFNIYRDGNLITNGINYSLGVGYYRFDFNVTGDGNYTNASIVLFANITKATQLITPLLNGNNVNLNINYPQQFNASYTETNQTEVTITLNGTQINPNQNYTFGVGTWNITWSLPSNQNYSSFSTTLNLTINQSNSNCNVLFNATSPQTYSAIFKAYSNCDSTFTLYRNGSVISNNSDQNLGVGTYNFTAIRTDTQNYTNVGEEQDFTINQANSQTSLTFDKTSPQTYGTAITPTCSLITGVGTPSLSVDGITITSGQPITLNASTHSFNCSLTSSQNYSASSNSSSYIINKNSSYVLGISGTTPITYGAITDVSGSGCPSQLTCSLDKSNAVYGAGTVTFNYSTNGNENYSVSSITKDIAIDPATSTLTLLINGTAGDQTTGYGAQTNVSASLGNAEQTFTLYENGTDITAQNNVLRTLSVGTYNFTASAPATQNYTALTITRWSFISTASQTAVLNINETSPITFGKYINVTCNGELFRNNVNVTSEKSTSVLLGAGNYNYSCKLYATGNYDYDDDNATFNVNPAIPVLIFLANGGTSNLTLTYPTQVNISASSNYGTVGLDKDNINYLSNNGLNITLDVGSYIFRANITGNQNYSNVGYSYYNVTITPSATIGTLLLNGTAGDINGNYGILINASFTNSSTATLYRNGIEVTNLNNIFENLAVGYYNFTLIASGNQNYNSFTISRFVNITKATPILAFFANGGTSNLTLTYPQQINISASSNAGTIGLDKDGINYLSNNGLNVTLLVGSYIFRANVTGNENYTDVGYSYYNVTMVRMSQTSASLTLDKIVSLQELNSTYITYNITLRTTNKGESTADNVNLIDPDSSTSNYDLGDIVTGNINSISYLKSYPRNSTNYNIIFAIASVNGTDNLLNNEISANSSEITIIVPAIETGQQLTLIKNIIYNSQTSTNVNYSVTVQIINSGGLDLTGIAVTDDDLNISEIISLNRTQSQTYSGSFVISKDQNNKEQTFSIARGTANLVIYSSNQIKIIIPGYGGGPNDVIINAPTSVSANIDFGAVMTVKNKNKDIGQDFILNYWLLSNDEATIYSTGTQTLYVSGDDATNSTTIVFLAPSSAGTYKIRANVTGTGVGVQATALSTIVVTSNITTPTIPPTGGGSSGGGGSLTGKVIQENKTEEIVCPAPYMRYGKECCLDKNNNSICDKDESQTIIPENETKGNKTIPEETPKNIANKLGDFFSSIWKSISQNKNYLFIGFGVLIVLAGIIVLIKVILKRKQKNKDTNRLKNTIGKDVYAENGDKIGEVKEVYLENYKIYGWLIKVNKNVAKKIKKKNILIRHNHVKSIKHIMIIDEKVAEHLGKLDSEST
ncbi:MAG: PRC-barrel domain-containing protein [archaeon]